MKSLFIGRLVSFAQFLTLIGISVFCFSCQNQPKVTALGLNQDVSIRGVDISKSGKVWISGSKGTIYSKASKEERWVKHSLNTEEDFRAIKSINDSVVIACTTTNPARVLKSSNGGETWKEVYRDTLEGAFFDALVVDSLGACYILGDPVNGVFSLYSSKDFGSSWSRLADSLCPTALANEYAFAASNQSAIKIQEGLIFVTGGKDGAYIHAGIPQEGKWKKEPLALNAGEACGAFCLAKNGEDLMLGGGCYNQIENSERNMLFSDNLGTQWFSLPQGPKGYVSSMAFLGKELLISAGDLGIQYATPRYRKFVLLENTRGLNTVECNDSFCIAAGKEGRVFLLEL